jgi:hypothetical protein
MTIHARNETDTESEIIAAKSQAFKTNKMQQKYMKQKQKKIQIFQQFDKKVDHVILPCKRVLCKAAW